MASIFTFDPDPPRVASPWSTPAPGSPRIGAKQAEDDGLILPEPELLADCGIARLEAEPQDGPTEYKLHLLLRPRRSFTALSTRRWASGTTLSRSGAPRASPVAPAGRALTPPTSTPTLHVRQNRLQHLTTQLLWRLQQSSPYHSSSAADLVVPILPEMTRSGKPVPIPGKLLPGLEESKGALYEIGVSDDGTFIGLTKDELVESLTNLRAMAASLGCEVQVLRTVIVGECEWMEDCSGDVAHEKIKRKGDLWVAEAFVQPYSATTRAGDIQTLLNKKNVSKYRTTEAQKSNIDDRRISKIEQLRVSLTGCTTSGKSTLLGSLSTSTLDNGRGKSRLSLLKHRHEIASGLTSSVAPALVGYQKYSLDSRLVKIINYGCGNVSSWTDVHNETRDGRLVCLLDSAGHPRFRRTKIRGLVSWAPHWTICCVGANDDELTGDYPLITSNIEDNIGVQSVDFDISKAHLDLCLGLRLPLIVVITKMDIATKTGLRTTLAKILSIIKSSGRQPLMLPITAMETGSDGQPDLQMISHHSMDSLQRVLGSTAKPKLYEVVPIVLTSAVAGTGISMLHALLSYLPIPTGFPIANINQPKLNISRAPETSILFHIDEVFSKNDDGNEQDHIVGGYLNRGRIRVGDTVVVGPVLHETNGEDMRLLEAHRACSYPGPMSFPKYPPTRNPTRPSSSDRIETSSNEADDTSSESWQPVRITSIRNLRLPVHDLMEDQVGTIGFNPLHTAKPIKLRKGMVLLDSTQVLDQALPATFSGFQAAFPNPISLPLSPGTVVITYIASIRASAKVISSSLIDRHDTTTGHDEQKQPEGDDDDEDDTLWGFDDQGVDSGSESGGVTLTSDSDTSPPSPQDIAVTFRFVTYREWFAIGTKILITPGGLERSDKSRIGLEGYVGTITAGTTT
ncbi:hypothetical protein MMC25_006373 [Agyrium rufum]|nr:hypothetical protein [Agyrium rufum]